MKLAMYGLHWLALFLCTRTLGGWAWETQEEAGMVYETGVCY